MRSALLLLPLAVLVAACSPSPPEPDTGMALPPDYSFPDRDTIRVVTWNLEHFVDQRDNPYIDAGRENDPPSNMEGRVQRAARALRQLDADLVVLQEAESEAFLQTLVEDHLGDLGYRFFTSVESPSWYMNVVLVSRYPLGVVRNYADVTTPIADTYTDAGTPDAQSLTNHRLWMADVRVGPDAMWTVVGAHLKAGRSARDQNWRIGQIRFLHARLTHRIEDRPNLPVLIAGDLNATANSPELRLLLNSPDRPASDSIQSDAIRRRARLTDPLTGAPSPTHPSDDPARQLDYLLFNDPLADRLVEGSARVVRPLPDSIMAATSDHLPVVASFRLPTQN
jgi:endonuclease/exonuclease/phosphatase family metal-dependent hydrolase